MPRHKSGVPKRGASSIVYPWLRSCFKFSLPRYTQSNKLMRNALDVVKEISKLVEKSPHQDATLQHIKQELSNASPGIRILCPTQWRVKANALKSIITNYEVLQLLWEHSFTKVMDQEMRTRIQGLSSCMRSFDLFVWYNSGTNATSLQ